MWNGHGFTILNAISFALITKTTILLYFKRLNVSVTILGIATAMEFIFHTLQIPGTRLLEKTGRYRAFVLRGWGARSLFTAGMAIVAVWPGLGESLLRANLMLFALFAFHFVRGISACAFLPWLTHLLPEKARSRYIITDRIFIQGSSLATMLAVAFYLSSRHEASAFAPLFIISFIFNLSTQFFIRRMPEAAVEPSFQSGEGVPWRAIWNYAPFRKFVLLNFLVCMAFGADVFWIPFLKDIHHVSDSFILAISVGYGIVSIFILIALNRIVDQARHSLVFEIAILAMLFQYLGWFLITLGVLPVSWPTLALQVILSGISTSLYLPISLRILMSIIPQMGRSHFFAIFNSMFYVTMGAVPLFWGVVLDLLESWQGALGILQFSGYTLLYAVLITTLLIALFFGPNIEEKYPMTTRAFMRELFVRTPARALGWIWR